MAWRREPGSSRLTRDAWSTSSPRAGGSSLHSTTRSARVRWPSDPGRRRSGEPDARSVVAASPERAGPEDAAILDRTLRRMVQEESWKTCRSCDLAAVCYAHHNARTFAHPTAGPRIAGRLRTLYELVALRGRLHITVRDLRSALAFMLTSARTAPRSTSCTSGMMPGQCSTASTSPARRAVTRKRTGCWLPCARWTSGTWLTRSWTAPGLRRAG